jgi:hypothetical protein
VRVTEEARENEIGSKSVTEIESDIVRERKKKRE